MIDLTSGISASDSRWSCQAPSFLLYIDDTGFEKIVHHGNLAFTFAGNGKLIQEWKNWLATNPSNSTGAPPTTAQTLQGPISITICIVRMSDKAPIFCRGRSIAFENALFAGTGATQARTFWAATKDAKLAVESAKSMDPFSGGSVKYLEFTNGKNNLSETATIEDVGRLLATEGTVMYVANENRVFAVPVSDAEAKDTNVRQVVEQLKAGDVAATAPCSAMYNEWSQNEISELHAALDKELSVGKE